MIVDPHDDRVFRRWVQFADDGSVQSVHDVVAHVDTPYPHAVDVTNVDPSVIDTVTIDPKLVAALKTSVQASTDADEVARVAAQTVTDAQAQARAALTVNAAKLVAARVQPVEIEPSVAAEVAPMP